MDNLIRATPPLFLFLLMISFSSAPSNFALSTIAISETANHTRVCALVIVPNSQNSVLNCSGFPSEIRIPVSPNISFSGIVAGDGFLCALATFPSSSISTMVCWRFSANGSVNSYKRVYNNRALSELNAGNSQVCGIVNGTNRLECWWPRWNRSANFTSIAVGKNFACGLSKSKEITCLGNVPHNMPEGNYGVIAVGVNHACAINLNNELVCWGNTTGETPRGNFTSLALGESRSCALQTNERVVCWGKDNFRLPEGLRETKFITIEAKRKVFCGVRKLDFSLVCWGNEHFKPNFVVFKEVMPGPCKRTNLCPCGPLAGSGNFCDEGYSICQKCEGTCASVDAAFPSLPPPKQSSRGGWSEKIIPFFVVGCIGSATSFSIIGFLLFRYFKCKGCRVHDSGRLDEPNALDQGTNQGENSRARMEPSILEKRLSQLTSMGNAGHLQQYSLQFLLDATNNFSEDHKVGTGSFGSIYRGILEDGSEVAIKRAEITSTSSSTLEIRHQEDNDIAFINELEALSRLHHKNLVQLLGFCEDHNERVLVYEYMHNGTLHDHLHKLQNSPLMSWPARIKVALDAARGIEYLHEYAVPQIIHRDIKSSNVLLDESWTAKVSDFGLSLMGPQDGESHLSLHAAGTVGYIDPEYYRLHILNTKSDVYSFGVLLLEILSGCKAIHKNEDGVPRNVVDFVVPYVVRNDIHRVLDSRVPPPTPFEIAAISFVGFLAADCVTQEGANRPTMPQVVNSLERALAACLVDPTSLSRSTTESSA